MTRNLKEHGFLSTTLEQRRNHKDIQNYLFACFLSQEEPKKVVQALKDPRELTFFLGLQVKQKEDGIFISQDKYVNEILNKFGFSDVKTARTPMETQKALLKDADVCACARFQDSPFDLVAYTDSDYAGTSLDRKSTTGGCQFLGCRLISWQCKKQIVVANSTTKAEYIATSNFHGHVLWIQNQLLDYGCIVKNHVFYLKTTYIEIRHHFIRDSNEKKLIQMIKIHTNQNVADLLTKAFDVSRFQYLISMDYIRNNDLNGDEKAANDENQVRAVGLTFYFLNARPIKYALTDNPTIYTACVEQFWATAKVKTVNREVQIQALVDKKKVIITETSVRSDLQLEDTEGTECIPNATIFEQLTLIGYENITQKLKFYKAFFLPQWKFLIHTILQCLSAKTTAWNEFSSTMASVVICLTTNQKFNFSKYIFNNMVKILEGGVKFLMYLRFVQVFLDKQVERLSKHKEIYVTSSHTKKVFANMKRQGKDFSGRDKPLFPTMIVQAQEQVGEGSELPTDSHHTPTTAQPSTSKPQKKQSRRKHSKDIADPQLSGPTEPVTDDTENVTSVPTHFNDPLLSGMDILKLNELMELCTSLSQRVLDLEKTKTSQAAEITELKERVKKLEKKVGSRTHRLRRLYKVGRSTRVVSSEDEEVTLVDETQGRYGDNLIFDTGVLDNEQDMAEKEVDMAEKDVSTADLVTTAGEVVTTANVVVSTAKVTTDSTTTTTVDELTLA
ncbi:hypothetical protein Tco_0378474 [Tanacetum coccineum]